MRNAVYFDIEIKTAGRLLGPAPPIVAGAIMRVLHGAFSQLGNHFAIAFPNHNGKFFSKIRIFAESQNDLDVLVSNIEHKREIKEYARLSYPRKVPSDYQGEWVTYKRYRIPSRRSERNPESDLRYRRLECAKNKPFLVMRSSSTGQSFSLHIDVVAKAQPCTKFQPDSYGLASTNRIFSVPDLP